MIILPPLFGRSMFCNFFEWLYLKQEKPEIDDFEEKKDDGSKF